MKARVILAALAIVAAAAPARAQQQEQQDQQQQPKQQQPQQLQRSTQEQDAQRDGRAAMQDRAARLQSKQDVRQQRSQSQAVRDARDAELAAKNAARDREAMLFDQASQLMDAGRWKTAADAFANLAAMKGSRADGALYWKAYSQDRLGRRAEALATLAELSTAYPSSRYLRQAQALDMEVRRRAGQPVSPDTQPDDELKLIAVNSLMMSDPDRAIPELEKLLQNGSPRVRERAVFVLAQSSSPRARQTLVALARGSSTPELQEKAVRYLGAMGTPDSRATLADIYTSAADVEVKREILRAFMLSGEKDRLVAAARTEKNPELRAEAVRQLGMMSAEDALREMYQQEQVAAVKKQIIEALFAGGNVERMTDLARTEKDPALRAVAVRNLGVMGGKTAPLLLQIYDTDKDSTVRRAVLEALFVQENSAALVSLARKESDIAMKKAIVEKLSLMRDKVATDYMVELLK
jgi:HEAT repeat protein